MQALSVASKLSFHSNFTCKIFKSFLSIKNAGKPTNSSNGLDWLKVIAVAVKSTVKDRWDNQFI